MMSREFRDDDDGGSIVVKRVFGVALFCIAAAVCVLPATAFGAQYSAYVGCSTNESAPSHVCQIGDELGAFFESPNAEVEYEVCVIIPAEKNSAAKKKKPKKACSM